MKQKNNTKSALALIGYIYAVVGFIFTAVAVVSFICNYSATEKTSYGLEITFLSVGLPFLIFGVIFAAINASSLKKIKDLKTNGTAVTGKIIKVRMNPNIKINNMHPFKADCEVVNPFDGRKYLYSSGNINYDIRSFAGEEVTVYIDKDNPEKYYVDIDEKIEKDAISGDDYVDYRK